MRSEKANNGNEVTKNLNNGTGAKVTATGATPEEAARNAAAQAAFLGRPFMK